MTILEKFVLDNLHKSDVLRISDIENFPNLFKEEFGLNSDFRLIDSKLYFEKWENLNRNKNFTPLLQWSINLLFECDPSKKLCRLFIRGKGGLVNFVYEDEVPMLKITRKICQELSDVFDRSQLEITKYSCIALNRIDNDDNNDDDFSNFTFKEKTSQEPFEIHYTTGQKLQQKWKNWSYDKHCTRIRYLSILNSYYMEDIITNLHINVDLFRHKRKAMEWYCKIGEILSNHYDECTKNALHVLERIYGCMINTNLDNKITALTNNPDTHDMGETVNTNDYNIIYEILMEELKKYGRYFKNKRAMYIFALTNLDEKNRCGPLGISREMYFSNRKATDWYNRIKDVLEEKMDEDTIKSMIILDNLYDNMIHGYPW